jgi:hypothetical protein
MEYVFPDDAPEPSGTPYLPETRDRGVKCSACFWFEVGIYTADDDNDPFPFIVHTMGRSSVPGKTDLGRILRLVSSFQIITHLTKTINGRQQLPRTSEDALAQAAYFDADVQEAFSARQQAA